MKALKIAYYEIKKLLRDRRWLLVFLIQPIILIVLLGFSNRHEPEAIKIIYYSRQANNYSQQIINALEKNKGLDLSLAQTEADAINQVDHDQYRGAIILNISSTNNLVGGSINFVENSTVPDLSAKAKQNIFDSIQPLINEFNKNNIDLIVNQKINYLPISSATETLSIDSITTNIPEISINGSKNTNKDIKYFDFFASAVIVLLIIIIGLNTSSTTITQERIDGTFERFFVTPYTKTNLIIGKMLAFTLVSIVLALVTILSLNTIFDVTLGPLWLVLLTTMVTALVALSLGILISSLTYTIAESIQVSILVFFSTLILTTFIFQPETMHPSMEFISSIIPFTYSVRAMREINILNMNFYEIWPSLLIIFGSFLLFILLSILFLRRRIR